LAKYNAQQKYEQGVAYAFGRGVPKNEVLAVQLFQQAADTGHAEAEHMLGYMYSNGLGGLTQDWVKANIWVRKAAEQGLAVAQDDLGVSYGDGRGVPQDWVECYMWIRMAANQRNTQAIQDLDYAKARMTPEQIAQAEQRAKEWKPVSSTSFERPY
jgi:TPR repeat protein